MAYAETSSPRQVEKISKDLGKNWLTLTDEERKKLKRGQFAFGSLFPFIFDGLNNAATHHKELFKELDDYYYVMELPIDDLCQLSLMEYQTYNREYFMHELLQKGGTSDKEEANHLRCIPIAKGDYLSIQPLIIGFRQKTQEDISHAEIKRLMNLKTYSKCTKVIRKVRIYVLKILINPIFEGNAGGWFHCPTALQAKINHMLQTQSPMKNLLDAFSPDYFGDLEGLFLRKYYLYLNSIDGSPDANYVDTDAIDLWEHVSPSELIKDGEYINIRAREAARYKLQKANRFFTKMKTEGLMKGAKAFPTEAPEGLLKGVFYFNKKKEYRIYFERSKEYHLLMKKNKVFTGKS